MCAVRGVQLEEQEEAGDEGVGASNLVDAAVRSQWPQESYAALVELAMQCAAPRTKKRPDLATVLARLGEVAALGSLKLEPTTTTTTTATATATV